MRINQFYPVRDSLNNLIKEYRAIPTGECRCPLIGEWYFSGEEAYRAQNDLVNQYDIAEIVFENDPKARTFNKRWYSYHRSNEERIVVYEKTTNKFGFVSQTIDGKPYGCVYDIEITKDGKEKHFVIDNRPIFVQETD